MKRGGKGIVTRPLLISPQLGDIYFYLTMACRFLFFFS